MSRKPKSAIPLKVGLTGGIASGKSTVCRLFAQRGVPVIDADRIARDVVRPGEPALTEIAAAFGNDMIGADGTLDRERMRSVVFSDAEKRRLLEAILHPRIRDRMFSAAESVDAPYCLLAIPLLVENALQSSLDRVLVVDVPEDVQRQRLKSRDRSSDEQIDAILASQISREQRLAAADDVIDNSGEITALEPQVARLHRQYQRMAAEGANQANCPK